LFLSVFARHDWIFQGGIHPRVKRIVGERLAAAARRIAYADETVTWTGPVLRSCQLRGNTITLTFDEELLKDDTILVTQPTCQHQNQVKLPAGGDAVATALFAAQLGAPSPLQVQLNGTNFTDGVWVPVDQLQPSCSPDAKPKACAKTNTVKANLGNYFGPLLKMVTAVRYAWGGNPCCPGLNRFAVPCGPNSCPIQTWNSTLPAVPFWASIDTQSGNCSWVSTAGGAVF
jgi:hypothetical protein